MDVLLDASAIMAVILNEPNKEKVIELTENALILSSEVISFEIGNALINLNRKHRLTEDQLLEAYKMYKSIPMRIIQVDIEKALRIACKFNIYAYDAYYLEIANRLRLPLITFDELMKNTAISLKIFIMDTIYQGE